MLKRGNCFTFAWYMFATRGGYCVLRRCLTFPGFHWLWCPSSRNPRHWLSYAPPEHKNNFFAASAHKVWYAGRIYRGDSWSEQCDPSSFRDSVTTAIFFIVGGAAMYIAGQAAASAYRIWKGIYG